MIFEFFQAAPVPSSAHADSLVCVVDDDAGVRRSLERLFRSARLPVETFASVAEYLRRTEYPGPVCLVLDVRMPGLDGFDLQAMLGERPEQVVFLTSHGDVAMCAKALKAGAVDFLTKPADDEVLLAAASQALEQAREIAASQAARDASRSMLRSLTPREFQVMEQVVAGLLNKQIAAVLGIAEKTVKIHRGRVMKKTRCRSVPDLMRVVLKAGDMEPPVA